MVLVGSHSLLFSPIRCPPFIKDVNIRLSISDSGARRSEKSRGCLSISVIPSDSLGVNGSTEEVASRPPFNLNLAVVLAGFAFESYTTPQTDVGWQETDAADCRTVFLSENFLREVYDGQLFIKLKKGTDFPIMDPWGSSDPYVILQLDGQVAKSKVKWATKEPTWNEDFALNFKIRRSNHLQVAAWDANLVTPHKRMGNAGVNLESLCDGNLHDVVVELEGIGGGGKVHLEVKYKSYDQIYEEEQWWRVPFVSDFILKSPLGSAIKMALGSESINARRFVEFAFGQLKLFNYHTIILSSNDSNNSEGLDKSVSSIGTSNKLFVTRSSIENGESVIPVDSPRSDIPMERKSGGTQQADGFFWQAFANIINQFIFQKLGFSLPENLSSENLGFLNKMSLQSQNEAAKGYVEAGLAAPESRPQSENGMDLKDDSLPSEDTNLYFLMNVKKTSLDVLRHTEAIFGALMVLTSTVSQPKGDPTATVEDVIENSTSEKPLEEVVLDKQNLEEMKQLFSSAESAMEAWAMLSVSLGHTSFIKSEFEKICFLDNTSSDTQVAIWRDSQSRRLVVAFRGTEQARWKDLRTDLMLIPAGLNRERLGGDSKQEVQVHSGFLSAYDSVRNRILALIKHSIGSPVEDGSLPLPKWHIFVTGHSLGGALATLLALELSSSQMAKDDLISVTMYNFGSPRVGNRKFVEVYNKKVKDSWRIVNHRDIIPTVPRLMGYCHVAHPVYLAAGELKNALANMVEDGYQVDIIGESTPDVLVNEIMKGEKQLIEKILQTEISLLRSIRDGSALMQHMEDFYYITLLESVRSNYQKQRFKTY